MLCALLRRQPGARREGFDSLSDTLGGRGAGRTVQQVLQSGAAPAFPWREGGLSRGLDDDDVVTVPVIDGRVHA